MEDSISSALLIATVLITLALVCYSVGVWSERFARRLKGWHLIFFWVGLTFDSTGTGIMFEMAGEIGPDIHSVTGIAAIVLMAIHAVWATVVLLRKNERLISSFHRFSIIVWSIWLIPYLTGFFVSMR